MFDSGPVTTAELEAFVSRLAAIDRDVDDADRVDQIAALERVKGAAAAAQARVSMDFDASQREVQAAEGVPARKRGAGVGAQIALARRDSPVRGSRLLGLARALVTEMPRTLEVLARGETTEWRAMILARETATLSAAHRTVVDARLAPRLPGMSDRQVEQAARAMAYQLDPSSPMRRIRGAVADRRVSIRPGPDAMARVTGFLPVAQGVAVWAALRAHAGAQVTTGDPRSRDQVMADAFTERLTGQAHAEDVCIEVGLVMTDMTLLDGHDTPARLHSAGLPGATVPAAFARQLVSDAADVGSAQAAHRARVWLRRLYASPTDGSLVTMDSRRRGFDGQLRAFLVHRDQYCRTPWCGAPVRHADHIRPDAVGGPTSADNGQGLCAACNHTKELPGWVATRETSQPASGSAHPDSTPHRSPHTVRVTTPTGHAYDSTAPPVLDTLFPPGRARPSGAADAADAESLLEAAFQELLAQVA